MPPARRTRRPLLALIALLLLLAVGYAVQATRSHQHCAPAATCASRSARAGRSVALSALPVQAQHTVALIRAGGPYPYSRDGIVFVNHEGLLPHERSGYYHEYTVPTPGETDRGPRRIIAGGSGEFYYTADHYASFRRVILTS